MATVKTTTKTTAKPAATKKTATKKEEPKKATPVKVSVKKEEPKKVVTKQEPKKKVDTTKPVITKVQPKTAGKTVYHVTKREKDGREWKVFIQGSDKVIKLFSTQAEALNYAKDLCDNKNDGSYVMLHGLDGKIRKF